MKASTGVRASGYFSLVGLGGGGILFTRTARQRLRAAGLWLFFAFSSLGVAGYSWVRPNQDRPGYIFFAMVGACLLLAGLLALVCWTEIEVNPTRRGFIKRFNCFGRVKIVSILPFDQVKNIRLVKVTDEFIDSGSIQVVDPNGKTWVTLPGYIPKHQGQSVRERIVRVMSGVEVGSSGE